MGKDITIDFSEYEKAVNRAYNMGEIRKRDISAVFRSADRPLVSAIKKEAPRGKRNVTSKKYPSRSHTAGNLKRNIKFKTSKKYKLVYYVNSGAWYTMIVAKGHGSYAGNQFVDRGYGQVETQVIENIKSGLGKLTERVWKNG